MTRRADEMVREQVQGLAAMPIVGESAAYFGTLQTPKGVS